MPSPELGKYILTEPVCCNGASTSASNGTSTYQLNTDGVLLNEVGANVPCFGPEIKFGIGAIMFLIVFSQNVAKNISLKIDARSTILRKGFARSVR